jgi:hypothetical protein
MTAALVVGDAVVVCRAEVIAIEPPVAPVLLAELAPVVTEVVTALDWPVAVEVAPLVEVAAPPGTKV